MILNLSDFLALDHVVDEDTVGQLIEEPSKESGADTEGEDHREAVAVAVVGKAEMLGKQSQDCVAKKEEEGEAQHIFLAVEVGEIDIEDQVEPGKEGAEGAKTKDIEAEVTDSKPIKEHWSQKDNGEREGSLQDKSGSSILFNFRDQLFFGRLDLSKGCIALDVLDIFDIGEIEVSL